MLTLQCSTYVVVKKECLSNTYSETIPYFQVENSKTERTSKACPLKATKADEGRKQPWKAFGGGQQQHQQQQQLKSKRKYKGMEADRSGNYV